jgi:aldehyde:ferredoxin oxidoreductase
MFEPAQEGFRAGKVIPFKDLMKDYYAIRGWDEKGRPSENTLKRLKLG